MRNCNHVIFTVPYVFSLTSFLPKANQSISSLVGLVVAKLLKGSFDESKNGSVFFEVEENGSELVKLEKGSLLVLEKGSAEGCSTAVAVAVEENGSSELTNGSPGPNGSVEKGSDELENLAL